MGHEASTESRNSQTWVLRPQFNRSVQVSMTCKENDVILIPRCQSEVASGKNAARNIFIFNLQGQCHEISDPRGPVCSPIWASYSYAEECSHMVSISWRYLLLHSRVSLTLQSQAQQCHWQRKVRLHCSVNESEEPVRFAYSFKGY